MLCSQIGRYQHPFGSWPWPLYDVFVLWPLKSQQRFCTKVFGTAPGMDDMGCSSGECFAWFHHVPSQSRLWLRFATAVEHQAVELPWPRRAKTWQSLWRHLEQLGDFASHSLTFTCFWEFQVLRALNTSQFTFAWCFWWGSWNLTRQPGYRMRTGCTCRPVKLAESCGAQKCSSFRIFSIAANCRPPFQLDCLMVAAVFTFSI